MNYFQLSNQNKTLELFKNLLKIILAEKVMDGTLEWDKNVDMN